MSNRYEQLDTNNKLIWNFRDIGHTMRRISEGKGSQKRILMLLLNSGGMTQSELTQQLGIQPGSASEVIGKLDAAGLITRTPSETDRRTADIRLSDLGRAAAEDALQQRNARHRKMFSCYSQEEKETLLRLLERLNRAWREDYGEQAACGSDGACRK